MLVKMLLVNVIGQLLMLLVNYLTGNCIHVCFFFSPANLATAKESRRTILPVLFTPPLLQMSTI